ncbi:AGAP007931-PA, partial [Anopheles gambiae str. PEST]
NLCASCVYYHWNNCQPANRRETVRDRGSGQHEQPYPNASQSQIVVKRSLHTPPPPAPPQTMRRWPCR